MSWVCRDSEDPPWEDGRERRERREGEEGEEGEGKTRRKSGAKSR